LLEVSVHCWLVPPSQAQICKLPFQASTAYDWTRWPVFRSSCTELTSKVCDAGRVSTSAPVAEVGCQGSATPA